MTKTAGMGDRLYVGGVDLSGDIQALNRIGGGPAAGDSTDITQSAMDRFGLLRDGSIEFVSYFDAQPAQAHPVLSALPTSDVTLSYFRGVAVGNPAASLVGKQVNYDPTRGQDGSLTFAVQAQANGFGLEWGVQLTAGLQSLANFLATAASGSADNSGFEASAGTWTGAGNCTVAQSAAQAHSGTQSLGLTSSAGGDMTAAHCGAGAFATQMFVVVPGQAVVVQGWFRSAVSARSCAVGVQWYTSGGASISTVVGGSVTDSTSAWTYATATLNAPATAAFGRAVVRVLATGAGAEVHYADDVYANVMPASYDSGGSLAFGGQAYLHVPALTGTDITIKIQDSADNITFADVAGFGFTSVTAPPQAQRIALVNTATIRRYIQAVAVTTAGFTAGSFAVMVVKNPIAGQVF
jgi:hypothetical protein